MSVLELASTLTTDLANEESRQAEIQPLTYTTPGPA